MKKFALAALMCAVGPISHASLTEKANNNGSVDGAGNVTDNIDLPVAGTGSPNPFYGLIDFPNSGFTGATGMPITSFSIQLSQLPLKNGVNGVLQFAIATSNTEGNIQSLQLAGTTAQTEFSPVTLGTGSYVQKANLSQDVFTFALSNGSAAQTALDGLISTGKTLRVVVSPQSSSLNARYAGVGFRPKGGQTGDDSPVLTLAASPVPEPASLVAIGLGLVTLMARRRQRVHP